jgi:cell division protein FtsB
MINEDKLKKRSLQGSLISVIGFVFILIGFVYAGSNLNKLNVDINQKKAELTKLDSINKAIESEIESNKITIENNQTAISELVAEINRLTDPKINVRANSTELKGVLDPSGKQIYDFNIWITSSQNTVNKIKSVSYNFNESSFLMKNRESTDGSNGFSVGYRGWGCLSVVVVIVEYKDGSQEKLYFDMCEALRKS